MGLSMKQRRWIGAARVVGVLVGSALACNPASFDPVSRLDSVRILASRADKPYAKPGDTVNIDVLAVDARPVQAVPMRIFWIPFTCINPPQDLFYLCFTALGARDGGVVPSGDAGVNPGLGGLEPGVDLTQFLQEGPHFTMKIPPDILHPPTAAGQGTDEYGLAIAFNIACAGHVELLPADASNRSIEQVPIGCFDAQHNQLGPDQFVVGFTRVYAYKTRTNANPVLSGVSFNGHPADLVQGETVAPCTAAKSADCTKFALDVTVDPSSQEIDPGDLDSSGQPRREQIWVDYFETDGDLDDDARLLYDPVQGKITGTATNYRAPSNTGEALIFSVVHDNRGGTAWDALHVHVHP